MTTFLGRSLAATLASLLAGAAFASVPVDALRAAVQAAEHRNFTSWSTPELFSAKPMDPGAKLTLGGLYATLSGRSMGVAEGYVSVAPTDRYMLWYGRQSYLIKGRSSGRFRLNADVYGVRALIRDPEPNGVGGISLQVQGYHPYEGTATTSSSSASYKSTKDFDVAFTYGDTHCDYELGYSYVRGASSGRADVGNVGWGADFALSHLQTRIQGQIMFQDTQFVGSKTTDNFRFVAIGAAKYDVTSYLSLEGDLTVMPFGAAVASGRITPMTSFMVYNPGSIVNDFGSNFVAYGSIRLSFHTKF